MELYPTATVLVLFAPKGAFGNPRLITLVLRGRHSNMICDVLQ